MRKLLSILGAATLASTMTSTLISCTPTADNTNNGTGDGSKDEDGDTVTKLTISDIIKQPSLGEVTKPIFTSEVAWIRKIGTSLAEVAQKIDENKTYSNFINDILPAYSSLLSDYLEAKSENLKDYGDSIISSGQYILDLTTANIATLYDATQSSGDSSIVAAGKDSYGRVNSKLNTTDFQFVSSSVTLTFTFVD